MTKIALVSPFTLPFYCGNSILVERLRQGLINIGFDAKVFNSSNDDPIKAVNYSPEIVHSLNAERPYNWLKSFRK